jgi:ribosomal protein S12 methylthiotransferase
VSGAAVHIVTLGCPKNEVDSDRMAARLAAAGSVLAADLETAQVAVVNTCAFIGDATEESIGVVVDLAREWKAARPGRLIIVTGCMASRYADDLPGELPEVDAFVPVADEARIAEVVAELTGAGEPQADAAVPMERTGGGPSEYVTVSDGCHRSCTYCVIPSIRGDYVSRPEDDIVAEARLLAAGGTREIVLVGQDVSAYGRGMPSGAPASDLPALVRRIPAEAAGLAWLRVMYVQPEGVTDELLDAMAGSPVVCRYLDIPLQHASERVLRAMGRRGDAGSFLELLSRVREALPGIRLRTTFIAGFPGERESDVDELLAFIQAARFDYPGVFAYSPEEGTPAATMPGSLSEAERARRANLVSQAAEEIGVARVGLLEGDTLDVLVEGTDRESPFGPPDAAVTVGRWRGQAPDVDGAVYVDGAVEPGAIVTVRIVETLGYDLFGEVV